MAWRIDQQVIRGEIDSRVRGQVTGRIWFVGFDDPVVLELKGNPWRDLAGHVLKFSNPEPVAGLLEGLAMEQRGVTGDITASRKAKIPDTPMEEVGDYYARKEEFPWHWGNTLYLEWFSERNGRVVIETAAFELEMNAEASWSMSEAEEAAQQEENGRAMIEFMDRITGMPEVDDDEPQSKAEAEADAEAARMDQLLDRVTARLEREGTDEFEKVLREERERLRKERGESEVKLTPEQQEERRRWLEEVNAAAEEAMAELEAEKWKDEGEERRHPLVERALDLSVRLHGEVADGLPEDVQEEHPLLEIVNGTMIASAKLGGALDIHDEWPPDKLFAGNVLVRLKKARESLRDALGGLDAAEEGRLAPREWVSATRHEVKGLLDEVLRLIAELRAVLED